MRVARNRQQSLLAAALFAAFGNGLAASDDDAKPGSGELTELRLRQTALAGGNPSLEEWKKLEADFRILASRHPKDASIRNAYGAFLWERNDRDGAVREWGAAERIAPKNAEALNHLAGASVALGDPRAALGFYLRAIDAEPENALTHFSTANVAFMFRHDVGRTENDCFRLALNHFAEAHRLAPNNPEFARGYAETFYLLPDPDWERALRIWKNYLNLVQDKDFALLNLARVYMKLGDAENARSCLAQVTGKGSEILKNRLAARIETELSPAKTPNSPETEKTSKPVIDGDVVRP